MSTENCALTGKFANATEAITFGIMPGDASLGTGDGLIAQLRMFTTAADGTLPTINLKYNSVGGTCYYLVLGSGRDRRRHKFCVTSATLTLDQILPPCGCDELLTPVPSWLDDYIANYLSENGVAVTLENAKFTDLANGTGNLSVEDGELYLRFDPPNEILDGMIARFDQVLLRNGGNTLLGNIDLNVDNFQRIGAPGKRLQYVYANQIVSQGMLVLNAQGTGYGGVMTGANGFWDTDAWNQRSQVGTTRLAITGTGATWSVPVQQATYPFAGVPPASANTGKNIQISDRSYRLATSSGSVWNWAGSLTAIS